MDNANKSRSDKISCRNVTNSPMMAKSWNGMEEDNTQRETTGKESKRKKISKKNRLK